MGYDAKIYDLVYDELARRRKKAENTAEERKRELYENIPRLAAIERELAQTGVAAAKAVLAGKGRAAKLIEELKIKNLALQKERGVILKEISLPEDYLEPQYQCVLCRDTGYVGTGMCGCMKKLLQEEACRSLSSIAPSETCSFGNFRLDYYSDIADPAFSISPRAKMAGILNYCREYVRFFTPSSRSVLMFGGTGLGKTHLSLAIAKEVIARGFGVIYGSAQNLFNAVEKDRFNRDFSVKSTDYYELLTGCDLLILDDLGAEFTMAFTTSVLYNVINSRLNAGRPIIINTNLDTAKLLERYGDRIVSRIIGSYEMLRFFGKDVRQVKRVSGEAP